MFTLVEALNYRCLRYVRQPLDRFHVLVGPNGSGKSTFLETISFLRDLVTSGLDEAIATRTDDVREMFWRHSGTCFEIAVEARIPGELAKRLAKPGFDAFRYAVCVGVDPESEETSILTELGFLTRTQGESDKPDPMLFPAMKPIPDTILGKQNHGRMRTVLSKRRGQQDNYYPETGGDSGSSKWVPGFELGPKRSTLASIPEDETRFPVATWFKRFLVNSVEKLMLNSLLIRRPSKPGQGKSLRPDGSNLPWAINSIEETEPAALRDWVAHLRTALGDLKSISTRVREDDRFRHLIIEYGGDFRVPSWMVSDGTLRLLALTLPAYLPKVSGVYLVEEPENGIHPRAVETMFQSLSSVYSAQVLVATHSPVVLSLVEADKVLCFAKTENGETDIVRGDKHPRLRDWKGEENLGVLFAGGVLS